MKGAYNRRNAYGAVVVFLPEARRQPMLAPMFEAIAEQALCGDRPLMTELGIDDVDGNITLEYEARPGTPSIPDQTVRCPEEASHA